MTEADWLACNDPARMLALLSGSDAASVRWRQMLPGNGINRVSDRKLRLWCCACCRHPAVWPLLTDPRSRNAVAVAERFADGKATSVERGQAFNAADNLRNRLGAPEKTLAYAVLRSDALVGAEEIAMLAVAVESPFHGLPLADLLRATINPYAPPLPAEVRTPLVVSLADGAYARKDRCQRCRGRGTLQERNPWLSDSPVGPIDVYLVKCSGCHGTGEVDRNDGTLDPQRLAVLSDALEEAGLPETVECDECGGRGEVSEIDPEQRFSTDVPCYTCHGTGRIPHHLLAALREQTPRYRGFWVVDMCLGRE